MCKGSRSDEENSTLLGLRVMLIKLSNHTAICQSDTVKLSGVVPLGAVSHRFNFFLMCKTK
jgi:hypothetical protein